MPTDKSVYDKYNLRFDDEVPPVAPGGASAADDYSKYGITPDTMEAPAPAPVSEAPRERSWGQAALDTWKGGMDRVADVAQGLTDFGTGALKQAGKIVSSPMRWTDETMALLEEAATGRKVPTPSADFWNDLTEPKGTAQKLGASTAEGLSYIAPGQKERVALNALTRSIPASARALRTPIRWLGRGVIGGSTAAGVAALNDDDPVTAGNTAAVVDMGVQPLLAGGSKVLRPMFAPIKRFLEQSSRESMSRAIGGPGANTSTKYYMEKFVNPLVRAGRIIRDLPSAIEQFRNEAQAGLSARDTARASMPPDYAVEGQKVLDAIEAAKDKFRTITGPNGTKYAGTPEDQESIKAMWELVANLRKSLMSPGMLAAYGDYSPQTILRTQGRNSAVPSLIPALTPQSRVLFDTLDKFKQELQNFAKQHGVFSGKQVFGQTPDFTPKVASRAALANELRPMLEAEMPAAWAEGNRQFSIRQTIADHLDRVYRSKVLGKEVPLSETGLGGFGADQNSPTGMVSGMPMRLYRRMSRSPFWNSTAAVGKDRLARTLGFQMPRNFSFGNVAAFANREPWEGVEQGANEDGSVNIRATQVDSIPDEEVGVPEIGTVVGGMIYRGGPIEDPGSWMEAQ